MLCPVQFHPVFAARIFLDTALPVLAAPHSLPALIPECARPAFCLNREESHVSIRQIIVRRASTRRAPAIASWPRARLQLTLTREKEEQKPDSATGGCQQKHCSHGKDQTNMPAAQTSPWNTHATAMMGDVCAPLVSILRCCVCLLRAPRASCVCLLRAPRASGRILRISEPFSS